MSYFSENAYLYLMALLFLLFVSPMSSISHNAESISHALLFIFGVFLPTLAAADDDDGLVDYECNGVGIFFFGSIYVIDTNTGIQASSKGRWH